MLLSLVVVLIKIGHGYSKPSIGLPTVQKEIRTDGDLLIGGLFPIHEKGTGTTKCGNIFENKGIHRVEAMLYALDQINKDDTILPGVKLGALILDTCFEPAFALNQSLDFVRDMIGTMDVNEYECSDRSIPVRRNESQVTPIVGVIGAHSSAVTIQVANLLTLFGIVQISPASTGAALSSGDKYQYFARTVPSDTFQAKAMMDIAKHLNWTYLSLVYSGDEYGELGAEAMKKAAKHLNICIAADEKIPVEKPKRQEAFEKIVRHIIDKANPHSEGQDERVKNETGAHVVVLFTDKKDTTEILIQYHKEKHRAKAKIIWLASESWDQVSETTAGVEETADSALVLSIESSPVPPFEKYFMNLHPGSEKFKRNVWLNEFWERKFGCSLSQKGGQKPCEPNLRLRQNSATAYKFDSKIQFVIDAVYSLAHALHMMWNETCGGIAGSPWSGPCPEFSAKTKKADSFGTNLYNTYLLNVSFKEYALRATAELLKLRSPERDPFRRHYSALSHCNPFAPPLNSTLLYQTLKRVQFTGVSGIPFKFDKKGDGPALYRIRHYRRWGDENSARDYETVGHWRGSKELKLSEERLSWNVGLIPTPIAKCSLPCGNDAMKKVINKDEPCCWFCDTCNITAYKVNETHCEECGPGRWPVDNRSSCYNIADKNLQYMRWNTIYSIAPTVLASFGIALTLTVISVYVKYNETPIVKASGRELSYILLGGMILCYLMTFILLAKPTPFTCGLKRVGVGLGFAVLYAAMLVKTNRIYRIFASAKRSAQRPKFISPLSQVAITGVLAALQLVASLLWLAIMPPATRHHQPNDQKPVMVLMCNVEDHWFLVSLCYDAFLILSCTVYAIKTRKVPENFNEAKFIGFTMYTTCIIWLAFVPIYFGTGSDFQIQTTTLCISISLSATVALFCLYSPKLWIILMEPEKNIRSTGKKPGGTTGGSKSGAQPHSPSLYSPLLTPQPDKSPQLTDTNLNNEKNQLTIEDSQRKRNTSSRRKTQESLDSLTSL